MQHRPGRHEISSGTSHRRQLEPQTRDLCTLNAMVMRAIAVALCAAGASGFMGMPSSTALRRCVSAARVARPRAANG
jgi:hypothetical protein